MSIWLHIFTLIKFSTVSGGALNSTQTKISLLLWSSVITVSILCCLSVCSTKWVSACACGYSCLLEHATRSSLQCSLLVVEDKPVTNSACLLHYTHVFSSSTIVHWRWSIRNIPKLYFFHAFLLFHLILCHFIFPLHLPSSLHFSPRCGPLNSAGGSVGAM